MIRKIDETSEECLSSPSSYYWYDKETYRKNPTMDNISSEKSSQMLQIKERNHESFLFIYQMRSLLLLREMEEEEDVRS